MFKTCSKCGKEFLATNEYFCVNNKNKDKLHNWCKLCQKEYDFNRSKNKKKIIQTQELASKQMKTCSRCRQTKSYSEFNRNRNRKDGLSSICKECDKLDSQRYRDEHPNYDKNYYAEKHKEEKEIQAKIQADLKARNMRVCSKCRRELPISEFGYGGSEKAGSNWCNDCHKEYRKKYQEITKERKRQYDKMYRAMHKEQARIYKINNADKIKQYQADNADKIKAYNKQRYENNKLGKLMSNAMCAALKGAKAGQHWEDLVPYNLQQLRNHLESLFTPSMTWDNYGSYWEVDHIIPQNLFTFTSSDDNEFQICWSLINLRPLEKSLNRSRPKDGSDVSEELKQYILGQTNTYDIMDLKMGGI